MTAPRTGGNQPISGATALVGVLGDPVRHSLSPAMHNAALRELGLDWVYLALPTPAERLAGVLEALEAIDCRGLNVTLPHKRAVARLAAERCPLAERVGAVNTLVRRPAGGWFGTNTDVEGFLAPLREEAPPRRALVLGCGGSARAVIAALASLGVERIGVAGRRAEARTALVTSCRSWAPGLEPVVWGQESPPAEAPLADWLDAADLVVNTTPVGMASAADPAAASRSPLEADAVARLRPGTTVYDLIYTPRPTALLRQASARGCRALDGLEMLVRQGAAALQLWSAIDDIPLEAMRQAAVRALTEPRPADLA
ncbi:MAG: shikimate dehydrogenase [Cyanobacteriota bacterium]|nr:shikimate dehydrogenase [Cyanobacteriota bacterium]